MNESPEALSRVPMPSAEWHGPVTDPWLRGWAEHDELLMCGLAVLCADDSGDDVLRDDEELLSAIARSAVSDDELLRRTAKPLAERRGLKVAM